MNTHFVVLVYEPCRNNNDAHATRYYFDNEDRVHDYLYDLESDLIDTHGTFPYEILVYEEVIDPVIIAH